MREDIKIYVACLAAYNNGALHGVWIDANQDVQAMQAEVSAMLRASPIEDAEEYAIHDHDGFEGADVGEYASLESVAELAGFIAEHGALGGQLVSYFGNLDDAREAMDDHYCGQYASLADFAQELTEQTTDIPDAIQYYVDWQAMARDLGINDVFSIATGFECVHVFWRH